MRDPFGRTPVAPALARERVEEERDAWWAPAIRPHFGGRAPRGRAGAARWRTAAAGRSGPRPGRRPGTGVGTRAGRTSGSPRSAPATLRRLGRWSEAAEAWQTAAAAGGGLGVIAWIEVAKLREHRLGDPGGALAATRAAWRLLERLRIDRPRPPAARGGPRAPRRG